MSVCCAVGWVRSLTVSSLRMRVSGAALSQVEMTLISIVINEG